MADFVAQKHEANEYNNGVQYIDDNPAQGIVGDEIQAETVNNLIESALYSQQEAESANDTASDAFTIADDAKYFAQEAKNIAQEALDTVEQFSDTACPPVGYHYIQYSGELTPASRWSGTSWTIDTAYQGRVLVGSGGSYTLGATGGSANAVVVTHYHEKLLWDGNNQEVSLSGGGTTTEKYKLTYTADAPYNDGSIKTSNAGESGTGKNMQPYKVVNIWKRTA